MRICVEGIDGAGKTSLSKRLAEHFGCPRFSFPDRTTPAGAIIDRILRRESEVDIRALRSQPKVPVEIKDDDLIEYTVIDARPFLFQCLHFTNRLEKTADLLAAPDCIIDRYWPSGVAYGAHDGLDFDWLVQCGEALPVQPDVFVLLDVDPVLALARLERRAQREMYERGEQLATAAGLYRRLWRQEHAQEPRRWWMSGLDAPEEAVASDVITRLENLFGTKGLNP